jgi:ankyrin repeat protein
VTEKNPRNFYHFTPLHMAAMNGHHQVCKLIIETICQNPIPPRPMFDPKNPPSRDGTTPLHNAALKGHLQVCQVIVENVQDKNPKDKYRHTPFDYAVRNGHTLVSSIFGSIGCDPPTLGSKKRKIDN